MRAKNGKSPKLFHTPKSKIGSGDYQGTGYKNPMALSKEIMGIKSSGKMPNQKKGKAPRSLA